MNFFDIEYFDFLADHEMPAISDIHAAFNEHAKFTSDGSLAHFHSQVPTPPDVARKPMPKMYLVSTTFRPDFIYDSLIPDIVLVSKDETLFYVHSSKLIEASENGFNSVISLHVLEARADQDQPPAYKVSEDSTVMNVVLHTIYGLPCNQYQPTLDILLAALSALRTYGIPTHRYVAPSTPLYNHILSEAPRRPIDVYVSSAENSLEDLAVASSAHLLTFPLASITDRMAERMGGVYLKRLVMLQFNRMQELKRLLSGPPRDHSDTLDCSFVDRKRLVRAWALATASLIMEFQPDLSIGIIRNTLVSLESGVACNQCKSALNDKVRQIVVDWSTTAVSSGQFSRAY